MVALKLVFQCLSGITALGAVSSGFYYVSQINNELDPSNTFVIFQSGSTTSTTTPLKTGDKENYFCKLSTTNTSSELKETTDNCKIYKLEETNTNNIDIESIISKKEKEATSIEASKKYLLQINNEKFKSIDSTGKKIEIFKNEQTSSALISFFPKIILGTNLKNPISNLLLVKSFFLNSTNSSVSITNTNKYYCQFLDEKNGEKFECDVHKTSSTPTAMPTTDAQLAAFAKTTTPSELTKGNYFVIDIKEKEMSIEKLRNQKIKLISFDSTTSTTANSEKEIAVFTYEQALTGSLSTTPNSAFVFRLSPSLETYWAKQTSEVSTDTALDDFIPTTPANTNEQNFNCKVGELTDLTCKLISFPEFGSQKSIVKTSITSSATAATKSGMTSKKYFKLIWNPSNGNNLDWKPTSQKSVEIVSNKDSTKKYATLKIFAKEDGTKTIAKTSFVAAKLKTKETTAFTDPTFKCTFSDSLDQGCEIYNLTTSATSQITKDTDLSTSAKVTDINNLTVSNYYLINLKDPILDLELTQTNQTISVTATKTADQTQTKFVFEDLKPFIATQTTDSKFEEVIFTS